MAFSDFFVDTDSAYRILCRFISDIAIICRTDIPLLLDLPIAPISLEPLALEQYFLCIAVSFFLPREVVFFIRDSKRQLYFYFCVKKTVNINKISKFDVYIP